MLPVRPSADAPPLPSLPDTLPYEVADRRIVVAGHVRLGCGGLPAAEAVQFLRECQSHGIPVHWSPAADDPMYDDSPAAARMVRLLYHLMPPAPPCAEPRVLADWRDAYAYGRFYYREGPGFLVVKDRRDPEASARFTLDEPDMLSAFRACLTPTTLDELTRAERDALAQLAAEGIVWITEGWAVTLPPRMRRWPVPDIGV